MSAKNKSRLIFANSGKHHNRHINKEASFAETRAIFLSVCVHGLIDDINDNSNKIGLMLLELT